MASLPADLDLDALAAELSRFLDPSVLATADATLALRLGGETIHVVVAGGAVRTERGASGRADATLVASLEDVAAMLTGELSGAIAYLQGRIALEGDERLAITLAQAFRRPGDGAATLDTGALDPTEIARVVRDTDRRQLERAVSGGARDVVLEEIFRRFPAHVRADRIADVEAVIGWKITGGRDEPARHRVALDRGRVLVGDEVDPAARPRVTIVCDGVTLLEIVTGNANAAMAFLTRRLRIRGDLAFAAQLPTFFHIPSAAAA